jgi:hypothetical protein
MRSGCLRWIRSWSVGGIKRNARSFQRASSEGGRKKAKSTGTSYPGEFFKVSMLYNSILLTDDNLGQRRIREKVVPRLAGIINGSQVSPFYKAAAQEWKRLGARRMANVVNELESFEAELPG